VFPRLGSSSQAIGLTQWNQRCLEHLAHHFGLTQFRSHSIQHCSYSNCAGASRADASRRAKPHADRRHRSVNRLCLLLAAAIIEITVSPTIASAQNLSTRRAVTAMYIGLIFAGDHALGWVLLLIGWAALKTRGLPRILSYLLVLYGIIAILEFAVHPFMIVGVILGIIWGVWLGVVLLRSKVWRGTNTAAQALKRKRGSCDG